MKTSEQINELATALAKAQGEMRNPEKNKTANIPTKAGGKYSYNYADLPSTFDCVRSVLSSNGIAHVASTAFVGSNYTLFSRLVHTSGQWIEAEWPLPSGDDPKILAASITYGTRYLFNSLVGISGDDDTDSTPESSESVYAPRAVQNASRDTIPQERKQVSDSSRGPSEAQLKRLWAITNASGWSEAQLKTFILDNYGVESTRALQPEQYQTACNYITSNPQRK